MSLTMPDVQMVPARAHPLFLSRFQCCAAEYNIDSGLGLVCVYSADLTNNVVLIYLN